jgi:hypothetical protein
MDDRRGDSATIQDHPDFVALRRRVARQDEVIASLQRGPTDEDRRALAEAQSRADAVLCMHSDQAPAPMRSEGVGAYRVRLARKLQPWSKQWSKTNLDRMFRDSPEDFQNIESMIYADAASAAREPTIAAEGVLVPVPMPSRTGHQITEYRGDPLGWMQRFMHVGACATRFGVRQ